MDFGLTDDQRDIQRTARELLGERAKPERVREHAEAGSTDTALWRELCELGWPGIAISEEHGGQGLGTIELSILCEELGRTVAPVPFLPSAMAACVIERAGSREQRERWLPGLASGETIGALAGAVDGTAELVIGGAEAGVIVLIEGGPGRIVTPAEAEVSPIAAIDPTRSAARVSAASDAGETLEDGCPGLGRALVAVSSELVGVCERALEMTVEYVKERKQFGTGNTAKVHDAAWLQQARFHQVEKVEPARLDHNGVLHCLPADARDHGGGNCGRSRICRFGCRSCIHPFEWLHLQLPRGMRPSAESTAAGVIGNWRSRTPIAL